MRVFDMGRKQSKSTKPPKAPRILTRVVNAAGEGSVNRTGAVKRVNVELSTLTAMLDRASSGPLQEAEITQLREVVETLADLTGELERKGTSVKRLQAMLFGAQTESLTNIKKKLQGKGILPPPESTDEKQDGDKEPEKKKKKRKGHGRRKTSDYVGATHIPVPHLLLKPGAHCPDCEKGKLYPMSQPARHLTIRAMSPIEAAVYDQDRLRCNGCGMVHTAPLPEGIQAVKQDETVTAMVGQLRYGGGMPFTRIENMVGHWGIPFAATTQWLLVKESEETLAPVLEALLHEAANGDVLHNDDTTMRVLERDDLVVPAGTKRGERTGLYTSGIVSVTEGRQVALFMTGLKHAGENLQEVLSRRRKELLAPIQMCDALAANTKGSFETVLANCLTHGRRQLVEIAQHFPDECLYMLEKLALVYHYDDQAREQKLSKEARLALHKEQSEPVMTELFTYMEQKLSKRQVEPNSGLGQAFGYLKRHWPALTLFLRVAGAPLDNSLCERVLKKAILHRKNSMFYKTANGARVGDLYMSLIHTCELNGENPFHYLVSLLKHPRQVKDNPTLWLPWTYLSTLSSIAQA